MLFVLEISRLNTICQ